MTDLLTHAPWLLATLPILFAALALGLVSLRAPHLQTQIVPGRQPRTVA